MKQIIINIDLTSSTGHPEQLAHKVDEIVEMIKGTCDYERCDPGNKIVYNDWDDPHTCDLILTVEVHDKG